MPAPDPDAVDLEEREDGTLAAVYYTLFCSNVPHRAARAAALLENLKRDGWRCPRCGAPISTARRADALYCGEGCRKANARRRRASRRGAGGLKPSG